jgi:hypothetical protein
VLIEIHEIYITPRMFTVVPSSNRACEIGVQREQPFPRGRPTIRLKSSPKRRFVVIF